MKVLGWQVLISHLDLAIINHHILVTVDQTVCPKAQVSGHSYYSIALYLKLKNKIW